MDFSPFTSHQQTAVKTKDPYVQVIAGPGSGKTKTLTSRIGFLVDNGTSPNNILAITFTKKAAAEMRERLSTILPDQTLATITTFHGFCYDLLFAENPPTIISDAERNQLLRSLIKTSNVNISTRDAALQISRQKNAIGQGNGSDTVLLEKYQLALAQLGAIDYDDFLQLAVDGIQDKTIAVPYFNHILVDEFQDTSPIQYELLKHIAPKNLFVIGDPFQAIYSFRGAGSDMFAKMQTDFPATSVINLSTNFRSHKTIVETANKIFKDQTDQIPASDNEGTVSFVTTANQFSEADWILQKINRPLAAPHC